MKYTITQAIPSDAIYMQNINESYLPENYSREMWKTVLVNFAGLSFVARRNNQIVGYILVGLEKEIEKEREKKEIERERERPVGMIISIAVLQRYRRHGIATNLLNIAHKTLKSATISTCYLHVRPSNENAKKLYEKIGYTLVERKKDYYPQNEKSCKEDGLLMRKIL